MTQGLEGEDRFTSTAGRSKAAGCYGKTPMQAFVDIVPLAREKTFAA